MRTRVLPIIGIMVLIAGFGLYRLVQSGRARNSVEVLRDSVHALRDASDSCTAALRGTESELISYRARLDSLYTDVRAFEETDLGGVPAQEYDEYMTLFRQYRDSAGTWQGRVESVQTMLDECRTLAYEHNAAVDSLRALYDRQQ